MAVSFALLKVGREYTRPELADLWGYQGYQALSRGLVTPSGDNKIILFITREKRSSDTPYENRLISDVLTIDGPEDHFAETRILRSGVTGDEIHLFYREMHRSAFTYHGQLDLIDSKPHASEPSRFVFRLRGK